MRIGLSVSIIEHFSAACKEQKISGTKSLKEAIIAFGKFIKIQKDQKSLQS